MKTLSINKSIETDSITKAQLKAISHYTRREMKAHELFVFSLILCDNEIDRDIERFTKESLEKLSKLYLGKTGVFDHVASSENQSARIFDTSIITDGTKTSQDDDYFALKAFAYMVRCDKTNDLILEIDAGIKKEVSVGCAVDKILCSVCSTNIKKKGCEHKKGNYYSGVYCYNLLSDPTDAYEWSFVAVPAQKRAGVTKKYGELGTSDIPLLDKIYKSQSSLQLSYPELVKLRSYLESLKELSSSGAEYVNDIKKDIILNASKSHREMDFSVLEEVCDLMSIQQLKAFQKSYQLTVEKDEALLIQLEPAESKQELTQGQFKI